MGESSEGFLNTQLVRIKLVILVDWEHDTAMDHIVSAPATL
jgi:hypothetical protein